LKGRSSWGKKVHRSKWAGICLRNDMVDKKDLSELRKIGKKGKDKREREREQPLRRKPHNCNLGGRNKELVRKSRVKKKKLVPKKKKVSETKTAPVGSVEKTGKGEEDPERKKERKFQRECRWGKRVLGGQKSQGQD